MSSFVFDGYARGLLRREHPRSTPPEYVREALNVVAMRGRWRSRPGVRPYTGAASSGPLRGGGVHYRADGTRDILVAAGANIERIPPFGDPEILPLTSLPSTEQSRVDPTEGCRFLSVSGTANLMFIYDGVNQNLKWDGVRLTRMGIVPPDAPDPPSDITGSVEPGQRRYVRTLVTPYHESNPSEAIVVTQVATGGKRFGSPTNGVDFDDPQVTQWKLYATQAGGARFFFVDKADLGVSIDHDVSDATLGSGTPLEELVNEAPDAPFVSLVEHKGLLFGITNEDRNLVRFCHSTEDFIVPEGWPLGNAIPVSHGDGDEVGVLVSFFEWLVVFKRRGTWAITGSLDEGFPVEPVLAAGGALRTGVGCIAPSGVIHLENEVIFPSRDGFYLIQRANTVTGGIEAAKVSDPIDELYSCANFALGAAASFDRKRQTYIFWSHG